MGKLENLISNFCKKGKYWPWPCSNLKQILIRYFKALKPTLQELKNGIRSSNISLR